MFERYTDAAKRVVFYARAEALNQNTPAISTKHLLLGLTYEADTRACQLWPLKENTAGLRSLLGVPAPTTSQLDPKREIPLDTDAKKTLAYAAREVDWEGSYWLDTDHLLRGLLRFPNEAAHALQKIGVELEAARAASLENRMKVSPQPTPKGATMKIFARKYWRVMVILLLLMLFAYMKAGGHFL